MKLFYLSLVVGLALPLSARAADWPQWRGPDRTGLSRESGLLKSWPKGGPRLVWKTDKVGQGYSSMAVVGDRVYTAGADGQSDYLYCLDATTGKQVWAKAIGTRYNHNRGDGPRGTPTVDGDLLFVIDGQGELACLDIKNDGEKKWSVNLAKDLGGKMMSGWGYSESPLVDGDRLVCSPGGNKGSLVALNKKTGDVLWQSKDLGDQATYSSIIVAEVGGTRQYIQHVFNARGIGVIVGVAADDGRLLWRVERPGYRTAVVPTPIYHDNHVYVTAGYGAGCDLIRLTPDGKEIKAEKVYTNKNMVNHHGGVVLLGGHVFGFSDGNKSWVCQNLKTGDIVWAEGKALGKGSLTFADGHFYCFAEKDGTTVLVEASPAGWKEKGRFTIPAPPALRKSTNVWAHPVVANGKLYLRDQQFLYCYDVREAQARR